MDSSVSAGFTATSLPVVCGSGEGEKAGRRRSERPEREGRFKLHETKKHEYTQTQNRKETTYGIVRPPPCTFQRSKVIIPFAISKAQSWNRQ